MPKVNKSNNTVGLYIKLPIELKHLMRIAAAKRSVSMRAWIVAVIEQAVCKEREQE